MIELLNTLNGLSPLAVIALLGLVIYLLVQQRKTTHEISGNHLSGLPEMHETLRRIDGSLRRIEDRMDAACDGITWIRARLNGRDHT